MTIAALMPNYYHSLSDENKETVIQRCPFELSQLLLLICKREMLTYVDGVTAARMVSVFLPLLPWHAAFYQTPSEVRKDYEKEIQKARFGLYGIPARYDFPLHSTLGFTTYPKKVMLSERKWIEKSYASYMRDIPNNPTGSTITVAEERIFRIHFEPYGIEPFNPFKLPTVSNKDN